MWPIAGHRQAGREGRAAAANALRAVFSDASPSSTSPPERPQGGPGAPQGRVLRRFAWGSGGPSESCPIMQDYRTSPLPDKRGGFSATQRGKAPPTIHHAQVIRTDLTCSSPALQAHWNARLRRSDRPPAARTGARRKPRSTKPFRYWRLSKPGRGPAEGHGRASRCLPPGPGSPCSTQRSPARRRRTVFSPGVEERRGLGKNPRWSAPTNWLTRVVSPECRAWWMRPRGPSLELLSSLRPFWRRVLSLRQPPRQCPLRRQRISRSCDAP